MPHCYFLAVASGSSLDSTTNNYTLFNLVEEARVQNLPANLPLETHVYWTFAPDELNVPYEMRLALVPAAGAEQFSPALPLRSATRRMRMRVNGLPITRPDTFTVTAEWREVPDGQWHRAPLGWPLELALGPAAAPTPP